MKKPLEKLIRDGKVAVLYSPRYGAGWYSWNKDYPQLLYHPKLVELVEKDDRITLCDDEKVAEIIGLTKDESIYCGGGRDLKIQWMEPGTKFIINEYDGNESIEYLGKIEFEEA